MRLKIKKILCMVFNEEEGKTKYITDKKSEKLKKNLRENKLS